MSDMIARGMAANAMSSGGGGGGGTTVDAYNKQETDSLLRGKANASDVYTITQTDDLLDDKVDKVEGKGLSTNDFTNEEKNKLSALENYDDSGITKSIEDLEENKANKNEVYSKEETDTKITAKVAEIVAGAPEEFNTLKEMSDWLTEHEDSAATMNTAILKNKEDIAVNTEAIEQIESDILSLQTNVSRHTSDITRVETSLQEQIDNLVIESSESGDVTAEVVQAKTNANGITYPTLKARLDSEFLNKTKVLSEQIKTSFNFDECVKSLVNASPLFSNGFVAENDCVIMGVETTEGVNKIDIHVAEGKYRETHKWRYHSDAFFITTSKTDEETTGSRMAYVSSYNLKVKKGDEVYIRFLSGTFKYSNDTENTYDALASIDAANVMTVKYFVGFNLILANESNVYDYLSDILNLKICTIGDSLTQGVDVYKHIITESYPFYLSRHLGSEVLNYGQMGRTSQTWWENYKDVYTFDTSIDVVLIMFGTNGGLTINTLDTDVEPYNSWEDYANTSVGCYCKLIEKIMGDTNNHAQIILMIPPYSTYSTSQETLVINSEATIRAIAKKYQLPVIDVLNESGMGKYNGGAFRPHDGCHFNAKGYHKLGTFIGSKLKSMLSTFSLSDVYDDETIK